MFKKIFRALTGTKSSSELGPSKSLAKSRLHLVLVQDRTGLPSEEFANFKMEMIKVIEKYFVIDSDAFNISYQSADQVTTLQVNSTVLAKHNLDKGGLHREGKTKNNPEIKSESNASVTDTVSGAKIKNNSTPQQSAVQSKKYARPEGLESKVESLANDDIETETERETETGATERGTTAYSTSSVSELPNPTPWIAQKEIKEDKILL